MLAREKCTHKAMVTGNFGSRIWSGTLALRQLKHPYTFPSCKCPPMVLIFLFACATVPVGACSVQYSTCVTFLS